MISESAMRDNGLVNSMSKIDHGEIMLCQRIELEITNQTLYLISYLSGSREREFMYSKVPL